MNNITPKLPKIDLVIENQLVNYSRYIPSQPQLIAWTETVLAHYSQVALAIVFLNITNMQEYNAQYRQQNKPTNVLAFPVDEIAIDGEPKLLGDILVCPDIVNDEAESQQMRPEAHWKHIIVHGILHLLGYDHQAERDAQTMEAEEIRILAQLGVANPYE